MKKTLKEFINENSFGMEYIEVFSNPNIQDKEWKAFHYQIRLYGEDGNHIDFFYSMGTGIKGSPKTLDVMESLLSDFRCVTDNSFNDFCDDLGYDPDSIKVQNTHRLCSRNANDFRNLIGYSLFNEFLSVEVE